MQSTASTLAVSRFTDPFISALDAAAPLNARDDPNYYSRYPRSLISTSTVHRFITGTGLAIYDALTPLLESTEHELILVTCFWAQSSTLQTLNRILCHLSDKAVIRGTDRIRVRLCFSSCSLFQKLFHKQSTTGSIHSASSWKGRLGLPDPSELGGLDLRIKSVFLLPFSVMHPKFMIVDRKRVVLPSCNISWEEWFEGAVVLDGPISQQFLKFYSHFWERREEEPPLRTGAVEQISHSRNSSGVIEQIPPGTTNSVAADLGGSTTPLLLSSVNIEGSSIRSIFLPSPHRWNPSFRIFAPQDAITAPPTPLNIFIITLFAKATQSIRIQTPNITAPSVLSALLRALARGIDVRILTSERLMILEQLVTAGTTTSRCVKKLTKRYRKLYDVEPRRPMSDEEAALPRRKPGNLHIAYFEPVGGFKKKGREHGQPQQSHLKLTIVDDEVLVLGSGNLDRASWFTSQELGVAFFDKDLVRNVQDSLEEGMQGRSHVVFDSQTMY